MSVYDNTKLFQKWKWVHSLEKKKQMKEKFEYEQL